MKKPRMLLSNKRAVSTIFVAVYVVMLVTILISTLFISLSIGNEGLKASYILDQQRSQESILIGGPGGMTVEGDIVTSLLIKNLGSITARIRALYIGQSLIFDPSKSDEDAYIEPKRSLWLDITEYGISFEETKGLDWIVTTERGSSSSELGDVILNGPRPPRPDTSHIRMGPFEISFEEFYWSEKSPVQWQPGWSIPRGTHNVVFNISVRNIDDEPIILTDRTCFVLVNNADIPESRLAWYIRPPLSGSLLIASGDETNVVYDRIAPGNNQSPDMTKFQPYSISTNYLIFVGYYAKPDGTPNLSKPLAQTLPFEAVFTAPG